MRTCLRWTALCLLAAEVSQGAEPGEGSCASDAAKVVPGHRRDLLQSFIGDAVELMELAGHGEEGYVWRGRLVRSGQEVAVKFRCDQDECQGETVSLRGHAHELLHECYAGSEAFRRAPQYVSGCFEDFADDAAFIVLQQVPPSFVLVEYSVDDFVKADKATHHGLLRQLLRAVCRFLDPVDGRSLVHNDLTAANIMWDPSSMQLTIMDFSQAEFCSEVVRGAHGCQAKLLLKDIKKELIIWALHTDLHGSAGETTCSKRAKRINFEKREAMRAPAAAFVAKKLGDCSGRVDAWTWSLLDWVGAVDAEIARQLAGAPSVPVASLFRSSSDAGCLYCWARAAERGLRSLHVQLQPGTKMWPGVSQGSGLWLPDAEVTADRLSPQGTSADSAARSRRLQRARRGNSSEGPLHGMDVRSVRLEAVLASPLWFLASFAERST
eukprot:s63_g2.t1